MKKFFPILTLIIAGFLPSHSPAQTATHSHTVRLLQQLIRSNTTNPPGNETRAAEILVDFFKQAPSIKTEIIESAPGRGNLIAHLPGTGTQAPLILLAHLDVVAANTKEWEVAPFEAIIKEGFLWGRGAIDMKGMAAIEAATLVKLAQSHAPRNRDIIFIGAADEETGGSMGVEWLFKHYPKKLRGAWVLNEGSIGIQRPDFTVLPIQVAEKGVCWMKLTAQGTSGHGSMPLQDNAVLKLNRAMTLIGDYNFPLTNIPVTKEFLAAMGTQLTGLNGFAARNLFTPILGALLRKFASTKISADPKLNAILRHTATPTRLNAGIKVNVIPNQAIGYVDARILPGMTPEKFKTFIQNLIGDDIEIEIIAASVANESPRDTALYKSLVQVLQKHYPDAVVAPYISAGATDSRFFRERNIPAYGFIPMVIPEADISGLHGKNERVPLESIDKGVEILTEVIRDVL